MRHRRTAVLGFAVLAAALSSACNQQPSQSTSASAPERVGGARAVPAAAASPADDGNWTMPGKDYASTRFSALNEITPANVGKLQVAATFSTGTTEGFEAPPLVVNNTMYIVTPWPNDVFALDLTKPRIADEMGLQAQASCSFQRRRLLRARQPRRILF